MSLQFAVDTPSDALHYTILTLLYTRNIRKRLLQVPKAAKSGVMGYLGLLKGLSFADLAPEVLL